MTTPYLNLGGYRLAYQFGTYKPGVAPLETIHDTLTGKTNKNFGAGKKVISFVAQFVKSSPATYYACYADMEALYNTNTAASKVVVFVDRDGTSGNYVLVGNFAPACLGKDETLPAGLWRCPVTLRQAP